MQDTTLLFTLLDADGISSREPVRLALVAVPDTPPQLAVRLAGIGSAITPQARLPVVGQISDDYGIARVWFEYAIDAQKAATTTLFKLPKHPTDLPLGEAALEVADSKLRPGQKLLVSLKAADLCTLAAEPNVGTSERWLLDVVSPEQLRAMLESRELVLRQRFEAIVQEVTETRDLLLRTEFDVKSKVEPAASSRPRADRPAAGRPGDEPGEQRGNEPGEEAAGKEELSPARQLELRTLRVQQALQTSRKNAQETLGVAEAFDDIRQQLTNNRIDTKELMSRLGSGIAEPLRKIAADMFPELERRLEALEAAIADARKGPQCRQRAQQQIDEILLAMRKIRGNMLEMEDFNELVESLRTIIKQQEQLTEATQRRHKDRIKELLEK
jgi:hypothetical protein